MGFRSCVPLRWDGYDHPDPKPRRVGNRHKESDTLTESRRGYSTVEGVVGRQSRHNLWLLNGASPLWSPAQWRVGVPGRSYTPKLGVEETEDH